MNNPKTRALITDVRNDLGALTSSLVFTTVDSSATNISIERCALCTYSLDSTPRNQITGPKSYQNDQFFKKFPSSLPLKKI